jgi:excisionase family DNA binding protein
MLVQGDKTGRYLTPREAGIYLGFSETTVRQYINRGLISAIKFGNTWAIAETECIRYLRDRRKPGRQAKNS